MKKLITEFLEHDIKNHPIFSSGDKNYVFINLKYFSNLSDIFNYEDEYIIDIVCEYLRTSNYTLKHLGAEDLLPEELLKLFNSESIKYINDKVINYIENNLNDIIEWYVRKGDGNTYRLLIDYKCYLSLI